MSTIHGEGYGNSTPFGKISLSLKSPENKRLKNNNFKPKKDPD
jgi:hypothetical protein